MIQNQRVTTTSFTRLVGTDEPHKSRRTAILAAHPEILQLYGPDLRLLPCMLCLVASQLCLAVYVRHVTWYYWIPLAYSVGGTLTHWISLGNHELAHNLCFRTTLYNEILAMIGNLAQGLPSAITFKKYHLEHHYFQGIDQIDVDVPSDWEGRVFNTTLRKVIWVLLQPAFYALRPLILNPKPMTVKELVNNVLIVAFDICFAYVFGVKALAFNILSVLLGMGLHPVAGHFIAEHYLMTKVDNQETFSYYGPLNWVAFWVGYHNEHHDFPRISGFRLPQVTALAPEFYNNLHSYDSWTRVIYDYIVRPDLGPYARVTRDNKKGRCITSSSRNFNNDMPRNNSKSTTSCSPPSPVLSASSNESSS